MKMTNITLSILLATSLLSTINVEAKTSKHPIEKILTKNKKEASNPYYKLHLKSVKQLTDEEALKYELELNDSHDKALSSSPLIRTNKIKIPNGIPGMEDGGFTGSNDNSSDSSSNAAPNAGSTSVNKGGTSSNTAGGLAVGTGTGGTISGGLGKVSSVLDGVLLVVDKLVAIGEKIIPTIEKGRPAVTNKPMTAISVIPRIDAQDPVVHEMGNWSIPVTKHYKITYSNGFGAEVVSFVYSVTFQYGGTYGGKGKYLAGVRVSARDIAVSWGFDLDATSQLIQISNVGTSTNVIAGATIEITYTVKNVMRNLTTSESFFVSGDGKIYKLD